ncbi:MAG: MFS transporter [Lysobacteraceae bacterium]|nr:MAG: MFS transporter [Xanthomonadaceae bacterium]
MSVTPCPTEANPTTPTAGTWALTCLALVMLLSSLGTSIANIALPTLVDAFDTTFRAVQWVVLAYLLAVTTVVVSVGRLGDLIGRRRLMITGIGLFTVASIACATAPELWMLVGARALQGLGAAVMMALAMALVGDSVPKQHAGRAMGFLGTMSAVGTALGPSLGGGLVLLWDWPAIFLINMPLGLLALLLATRYLPADVSSRDRPSLDIPGSVVLAITLAAYAIAMTQGRGALNNTGTALLCLAAVGAFVFVAIESKARSPLIRPQLFRRRLVATGFAMSVLVTTVVMTTLVVGPFYLTGALGLSPAAAGAVMTAGPLVAALVGVPAGRGVDHFGAHRVTVTALIAMVVGTVSLTLLPASLGAVGYVLPLITLTAGFAAFQVANNAAVVTGVEANDRGVVSGLLNLARNLGLITGASVMGTVFAAAVGEPGVAAAGALAIANGMHTAFAAGAMLVGVALLLAVGMARPSPSPTV